MDKSPTNQLFEAEVLKIFKKLTKHATKKDDGQEPEDTHRSQSSSGIITKDSFNDIENVVFQGGGILGLAYLGVLKKFDDNDYLDKIKRIGGTSAGSIVALYLGLNMSYQSMDKAMSRSYTELLDTDIKLKVKTNPKALIRSYQFEKRSIKDIVLSATYLLLEMEAMVRAHDQRADDKLSELVNDIIDYFMTFTKRWLKTLLHFGSWFTSKDFVEMAVKWFFGLITPKSTDPNKFTASYGGVLNQNNEKNPSNAKHFMQCTTGYCYDQKCTDELHVESSVVPTITGSDLHYSIAQLMWFILFEHTDSEDKEVRLGLFTADKIRQELIEDPIVARLKETGQIANPNCTFAELAACVDKDTNKPIFRPFYIVAFNTSTLRSEIFSAKHTPDVVVADAVRASMSIPVFFQPVTVREKNAAGELVDRKIHYEEINEQGVKERKEKEIYYMDGGIYDNYALWLFDDLKYCLPEDLANQMNLEKRIPMQNPKTLGFKLIGQTRMEIYKRPYYDEAKTKMKRVSALNYTGDFAYMASTLIQAEVQEHEESDFINQEYSSRTGYVDNHSISAIAFGLTQKQKDDLIRSGEAAVEDYFRRVESNFAGEGQRYS